MGNCNKKKKFKSFTEANKKKNELIRRYMFSTLVSYWCKRHECVHLGHSRTLDNQAVVNRYAQQVPTDLIF